MELPKIYSFLDSKYQPFIRYVFILPSSDFYSFLESIKNKKGIAREFHGYEIESDLIEFWDASNHDERTVKINFDEFVDLVTPLKNVIIKKHPEQLEQIEFMIKEISKIY